MADGPPDGPPDDADATLARRAVAGDREAFRLLVERHGPRVHDLARRMLRDAHEAEDVAQQAFWNAWRALRRFDPSRPFRNWILRITTNLCRNQFAARRRRPHLPAQGDDDAPWDPPAPTPPAASAAADVRERVRAALDALPERYRLCAVLRYVHDLSVEDIAEVTGDPQATVKVHLFRARGLLEGALRDLAFREAPTETSGPPGGTPP